MAGREEVGAARAYLFDANAADLRGRESQVRLAGLDGKWEMVATSSRNHLLLALEGDALSVPPNHSVTLLDFRSEADDLEQVGFRLAETIRRHRLLWKATRPLVWVDYLSAANVHHARMVGAEAVIDDDWIDREDGRPLAEILDWAAARRPRRLRDGVQEPEVFSDRQVDLREDLAARDDLFERRFGFPPDELDFHLLWGMADGVELSFLYGYLGEQGVAVSERSARKACERLQAAMRPDREQLDRPEPTNAELARQFLATTIPAPNPLAEISWPGFAEAVEILASRHDIVRLAFLEPEADRIVRRFLVLVEGDSSSALNRYRSIEDAVEQVAKAIDRPLPATRRLIQRSLHSLDDAYDDWRRHGAPSVKG